MLRHALACGLLWIHQAQAWLWSLESIGRNNTTSQPFLDVFLSTMLACLCGFVRPQSRGDPPSLGMLRKLKIHLVLFAQAWNPIALQG